MFDIEHRANDIVGDELWQMGRDGQHFIVMGGIHDIDHRAGVAPEFSNLFYRRRIASFGRREDAPVVFEEFRETGLWARMLGACHRMGWHQMHPLGQMRRNMADNSTFDGADIGHDSAGHEVRPDRLGDGGIGAHRRAQNH